MIMGVFTYRWILNFPAKLLVPSGQTRWHWHRLDDLRHIWLVQDLLECGTNLWVAHKIVETRRFVSCTKYWYHWRNDRDRNPDYWFDCPRWADLDLEHKIEQFHWQCWIQAVDFQWLRHPWFHWLQTRNCLLKIRIIKI